MGTSDDVRQDQQLADIDVELRNLRKCILSNTRTMNKIAKDVNARLAKLEPSGQPTAAPAKPRARRKSPKRGEAK